MSLSDALQSGSRRRPSNTDPLVGYGRHFGRSVHLLCNIPTLLHNGLQRDAQIDEIPEEDFTPEAKREHDIYNQLCRMVPNLKERLTQSEEEFEHVSDLLRKGCNSARADDTKSLKTAVIDWIRQPHDPPLARNVKSDRGFNSECTGRLLCPVDVDWETDKSKLASGEMSVTGDQWPRALYDGEYDPDEPWQGLFRSHLLVCAFRHIFTSPSSVNNATRATRSGNARIHGMSSVTPASLAYVATQLRFTLTSASVFSRTDLITDNERFYHTIMSLLLDPEEVEEVNSLLEWWNRQIFPASSEGSRPYAPNSAFARIKAKRKALRRDEIMRDTTNSGRRSS